MAVFPQMGTGASVQYPARRRRNTRTITNQAPDGTLIKLADAQAAVTEWQLHYEGLTAEEAGTMRGFFAEMEGRLGSFTYLDPLWNLLAWSEQLDRSVWQRDPLLSVTAGVDDPLGTARAWRLHNTGQAAQRITQTLEAPAAFSYCLSLYARSAAAATVSLVRDGAGTGRETGPDWRRLVLPGSSESQAETVTFGIEVAAGGTVEVFGLQVEAQIGASGYKATGSQGGVYQGARFADDVLTVTCTDVGRYGCGLRIMHGNHS